MNIAPGNLQYQASTNTWRFAERQFDRCGNGSLEFSNVYWNNNGYQTLCDNTQRSATYEGWIDMFGWGTSGHGQQVGDKYTRYFMPYDCENYQRYNEEGFSEYNRTGYGPSFDASGTAGVWGEGALSNHIDTNSGTNRYFDWGYANTIMEQGKVHKPGTWRTLTADEWNYLLFWRKVDGGYNAFSHVNLRYGSNEADTIVGVMLYPDDFSFTQTGITRIPFGLVNGTNKRSTPISIDIATWNSLESVGCIFLPCASATYDNYKSKEVQYETDYANYDAYYWTSTATSMDLKTAMMVMFCFDRGYARTSYMLRNNCYPVRLVKDVE